jgi:hypothetical protein
MCVHRLLSDFKKQFGDGLLNEGKNGGAAAAVALDRAVTDYLKLCHPEHSACRIIVRVYADYETLSAEIITVDNTRGGKMKTMERFAQGFSSANSWFDFINIVSEGGVISKISGKLSTDCAMYCLKLTSSQIFFTGILRTRGANM